jgi:serine/threonine protein kinase
LRNSSPSGWAGPGLYFCLRPLQFLEESRGVSNDNSHPTRVGRYAVGERIGRGAMGEVYAAVEEHIARRVAVRIGFPGDLRVHQQARMTGQVAHPNVVSVLDLGEHDGRPYVAMELLEGATLETGGGVAARSLDARLELMDQVCLGLQAAHERGMIHGHLKPGHVFVTDDRHVKLLDFGAGDGRPDAYASPEQVKGLGASQRSDVFSAGAVFHYLLTGRAPFASNAAVVADPPPAISVAAAPEALSRAVLKALEKDPDLRQQSINHLRAEIAQVRQGMRGNVDRVLKAAFDRYHDLEALVAQRRGLGRRLGLPDVERECDRTLASLASVFPEFARAGLDYDGLGSVDAARAAEALAELQTWHNRVLAEVALLRAAGGERV